MMKSRKGITIIEIVVVIIILILLAIIAIYNANPTLNKAQAAVYESEFRALYGALNYLQTSYNMGDVEYTQGVHFAESYEDPDDNNNTWYIIYGDNYYYRYGYSKEIFQNLGLDGLNRSYEFKMHDNTTNSDDIKIRLYNGEYLNIGEYKVRTYDEIEELMNSGAI